ncbi:MAG: hypothetical protein JSS64_02605 [Bacteroidetes bacterium]|nr:hypothetical protein [Bacteroidota bacterium]
MASFLKSQINSNPDRKELKTTDKQHKRINKNAIMLQKRKDYSSKCHSAEVGSHYLEYDC